MCTITSETARWSKWALKASLNWGGTVTVHNSQGGEWPAAIVDPASNRAREWQNHPEHRQSYARWVYTAVTRAQEEVWCLRLVGEE